MTHPTSAQLAAAFKEARQAINDYAPMMGPTIPDDAIETIVNRALIAAFNVQPKGNLK